MPPSPLSCLTCVLFPLISRRTLSPRSTFLHKFLFASSSSGLLGFLQLDSVVSDGLWLYTGRSDVYKPRKLPTRVRRTLVCVTWEFLTLLRVAHCSLYPRPELLSLPASDSQECEVNSPVPLARVRASTQLQEGGGANMWGALPLSCPAAISLLFPRLASFSL